MSYSKYYSRPNYLLLLADCFFKRLVKNSNKIIQTDIKLPKGTLLELISPLGSGSQDVQITEYIMKPLEPDDIEVSCTRLGSSFTEITALEAQVLLPISPAHNRIKVYENKEWLDEIPFIIEGRKVQVTFKDGEQSSGVVRFKGVVHERGPGIRFGVELQSPVSKSNCEYLAGENRYFACALNKGVFVSIFEVRLHQSEMKATFGKRSHRIEKIENTVKPSENDTHIINSPLKINDRVVWISDNGPEYGVVHWLGSLPNNTKDMMAGVEFENPVGTGTGRYNDMQLFETKLNHASLVPVIGLLKADDYKREEAANLARKRTESLGTCTQEKSPQGFHIPSKHSSTSVQTRSLAKIHAENYLGFEEGSVVEVSIKGRKCYGVIRWIGDPEIDNHLWAGLEMEEESDFFTDGTKEGRKFFDCNPGKGHFVRLLECREDKRFEEEDEHRKHFTFDDTEATIVPGKQPPLTRHDLSKMCGMKKGIQGHHNSCYLDATLFAMFSCSAVFDSILYRPYKKDSDIKDYKEVCRVLEQEIVNPLRKNSFVAAKQVMKLRELLDRLSNVSGLTTEEKDPEEFLNSLTQILKVEPFLKLSSGQDSYLYQLFLDKDESLGIPTVKQLFDQSFLASDIKLREVPSCLIIQMPRFGRQFKMYPRILPSLYLDITDVLENSPRQCTICGCVASHECKQCFGNHGEGLESISFCSTCLAKVHAHERSRHHHWTDLKVPQEYLEFKYEMDFPRIEMELFAIVCIETSHYVCFVKCGDGPEAPWCFFDSMADRKGGKDGYNIPEVRHFQDFKKWMTNSGRQMLLDTPDDKLLPPIVRKLFCDAYMCMYREKKMEMYK